MLGSCAGLIMLDREHLGLMDIRAERNAFGRQIRSFEADLELRGSTGGRCARSSSARRGSPSTAPTWRSSRSSTATPVAAREANMLAVAFHAELGEDDRLHRLFLQRVRERAAGASLCAMSRCASRWRPTSSPVSRGCSSMSSSAAGIDALRHGALAMASASDWAWASEAAARDVAEGRAEQGIVCCWTGTGASIAANKVDRRAGRAVPRRRHRRRGATLERRQRARAEPARDLRGGAVGDPRRVVRRRAQRRSRGPSERQRRSSQAPEIERATRGSARLEADHALAAPVRDAPVRAAAGRRARAPPRA
jgi:hypothetical protein